MLLQAREGRTWSLGLSDDTNALIAKSVDQLVAEGLVNRLLGELIVYMYTPLEYNYMLNDLMAWLCSAMQSLLGR